MQREVEVHELASKKDGACCVCSSTWRVFAVRLGAHTLMLCKRHTFILRGELRRATFP